MSSPGAYERPVRIPRSGAADALASADPLWVSRPPYALPRAGLSSSRARAGGVILQGFKKPVCRPVIKNWPSHPSQKRKSRVREPEPGSGRSKTGCEGSQKSEKSGSLASGAGSKTEPRAARNRPERGSRDAETSQRREGPGGGARGEKRDGTGRTSREASRSRPAGRPGPGGGPAGGRR